MQIVSHEDVFLKHRGDPLPQTPAHRFSLGSLCLDRRKRSPCVTAGGKHCVAVPVDTAQHPDNIFMSDRPAGVEVFIRENAYQPGRAHIIIYNWDLAETVDVDLTPVMNSGTAFQLRNAQDYFEEPVVAGVFDGSPVSIPLADLTTAQPFGSSGAIQEHETTGLEFNVLVLIANPCGR